MVQIATDMRSALANAVSLVNRQPGQTCVRLRFRDDYAEDFVANSAILNGESFTFTAGFDTYGGTLGDLKDIDAELITGVGASS